MKPLQVTIIGGGFCGVMTAINLMRQTTMPLHIHIINKGNALAKGVAFDPHSSNLLLNVPAGKMSAFVDVPNDFTNWLKTKSEYNDIPEDQLAADFAPREQYGYYLTHLWQQVLNDRPNKVGVWVYDDEAYDMVEDGRLFYIYLKNHQILTTHFVVLATGNAIPRLPSGIPLPFSTSKCYFGNPWKRHCMEALNSKADILIIGNGLTMADTVLGLAERDFKGTIYTVSPHGYNLNPWKEAKEPYTGFDAVEMLRENNTLAGMLNYINRHRKAAKKLGQSGYQLVDALRPHAQEIWRLFSRDEKQQFVKRLRHFWESVRHRLPVKMHDFIANMHAERRLITYKGTLAAVTEADDLVNVTINCHGVLKQLQVQRIINCTGPESSLERSNDLLKNMRENGLISADTLNLGINAHPDSGRVISPDGKYKPNLFVIGNNLKGVLWESTAVPELRVQAKKLADHLVEKCESFVLSKQHV